VKGLRASTEIDGSPIATIISLIRLISREIKLYQLNTFTGHSVDEELTDIIESLEREVEGHIMPPHP
jgi:hypothetical protein